MQGDQVMSGPYRSGHGYLCLPTVVLNILHIESGHMSIIIVQAYSVSCWAAR